MSDFYILLTLVLVGTASYYSYMRGLMYGGKVTIDALENAGIIRLKEDGDDTLIESGDANK